MKIAVTYDKEQIFQHFGHTEQFKIYVIKNDEIVSKTVVSTNGQGHGALSSFLKENNVDVLICGGIGGGAISALNELGIKLFGGVSGDCDGAVEAFLKNELEFNPNVRCSHHEHEHGDGAHTCGEHGCGKGSCQPKRNILTFNYALISAPIRCIEYVVYHEFTHFMQPNHSRKFYLMLSTFLPDWRDRKKSWKVFPYHYKMTKKTIILIWYKINNLTKTSQYDYL